MPKRKPKTKAGKSAKMEKTMGEYKRGELHSGSKDGPKVKSRDQAVAIGMHQSGQSKPQSSKRSSASREKRLEGKPI